MRAGRAQPPLVRACSRACVCVWGGGDACVHGGACVRMCERACARACVCACVLVWCVRNTTLCCEVLCKYFVDLVKSGVLAHN